MKLTIIFSNSIAWRCNPNIGGFCAICGMKMEGMSIWKRFANGIYRGKNGIDRDPEQLDPGVPGCGHNFIQSYIIHSNGERMDIYTWLPCHFCKTQMVLQGRPDTKLPIR